MPIAISVRADVKALSKSLDAFAREQLPFATALTLTGLARRVRDAEVKAMGSVFDHPTPFTLNSVGVKAAMAADGVTIQQFNEVAGGQVVFHLHFHILPRWTGLALRPPGTMGNREIIAEHAGKIAAAF